MTALAQCVSRECTGKVELYTNLNGQCLEACRGACGYVGLPRATEGLKPAWAPKRDQRRAHRKRYDEGRARRQAEGEPRCHNLAPMPMTCSEAGTIGGRTTNARRPRLPPIETRRSEPWS